MYRVINSEEVYGESIFTMTTVGRNRDLDFSVAVNPSTTRIGECYLKYYNAESYRKATAVARLNLRKPEKVYHRNIDNLEEWELNAHDRRNLCRFLDSYSTSFKATKVTYWQLVLYNWDNEWGFLEDDYPDVFSTHVEAFISGFYDIEENLQNPSYMSSTSQRPDYTKVEN